MALEWLIAAGMTCLLTVISAYYLIPSLRIHKIGQYINEFAPETHRKKSGTPSMCGVTFIMAILVVMSVFFAREVILGGENVDWIPLASTLFLAAGNGAIGFLDDFTKLKNGKNQGLKSRPKLLMTLLVATAYITVMGVSGYLTPVVSLPMLNLQFDLGFFYYPFAVVVLTGMVHAVNITDGIDGLASSISAVVAAFFLVVAAVFGGRQVGICGAVLLGGTIGFLVMNHHPAKAFMGDTGSLFLGGFIIGVGFMINQPVVLLIAGLVFVFEMITSFIQIIAIRCFDKHVFKKAPFHHHLEQCNWNEIKIVAVFSAVTVVCCVVAFFGLNGNLIR